VKEVNDLITRFNQAGNKLKQDIIPLFPLLTSNDIKPGTLFQKINDIVSYIGTSSEDFKEFILHSNINLEFLKTLYENTRILVDYHKFIGLILPRLAFSDKLLKLIPNENSVHAEMAILEERLQQHSELKVYIGISKLTCELCYTVLKILKLDDKVRGSHGILYTVSEKRDPEDSTKILSTGWLVPDLDEATLQKFRIELEELFPKGDITACFDGDYTGQNESPNTKVVDFSDDEKEPEEVHKLKQVFGKLKDKATASTYSSSSSAAAASAPAPTVLSDYPDDDELEALAISTAASHSPND
jgi:hypothetical protein